MSTYTTSPKSANSALPSTASAIPAKVTNSWRDVIKVHPAADVFPRLPPDELKALGKDIKKNGLQVPVVLWNEPNVPSQLLDGVNRLDAMEAIGLPVLNRKGDWLHPDIRYTIEHGDPYAFVYSINIHRRHLTAEQKRNLIAQVLKAQPEKSNREIARQVKDDHHKVGAIRRTLEATGEVSPVEKTTGADGKARTTTPKKKKRRDVDDYIAEKKARLTTAKAAEAPLAWQQPVIDEPKISNQTTPCLVTEPGTATCSFCRKNSEQVATLIKGELAFICNECIDHCCAIIATHKARKLNGAAA